MKTFYLIFITVFLVSCTPSTATEKEYPTVGKVIGTIPMNGGGTSRVYTFEVDGTKCILVGRYSALTMSCNWNK